MNTTELLELFRKDVRDEARPYLWSDAEILTYMNDAYFMFVRLVGGIPDFTSEACSVAATAFERDGVLHEAVLVVRAATLESDGHEVKVINIQDTGRLVDVDYGVVRSINTNNSTGEIRYMVVGMERGKVQFVNIPVVDENVLLVIDRLPLVPLTELDQDIRDIDSMHHPHLLRWMQKWAFSKTDADTYDPKKAALSEREFVAYCEQVKREKERYKHKPRVVAYGGL